MKAAGSNGCRCCFEIETGQACWQKPKLWDLCSSLTTWRSLPGWSSWVFLSRRRRTYIWPTMLAIAEQPLLVSCGCGKPCVSSNARPHLQTHNITQWHLSINAQSIAVTTQTHKNSIYSQYQPENIPTKAGVAKLRSAGCIPPADQLIRPAKNLAYFIEAPRFRLWTTMPACLLLTSPCIRPSSGQTVTNSALGSKSLATPELRHLSMRVNRYLKTLQFAPH